MTLLGTYLLVEVGVASHVAGDGNGHSIARIVVERFYAAAFKLQIKWVITKVQKRKLNRSPTFT